MSEEMTQAPVKRGRKKRRVKRAQRQNGVDRADAAPEITSEKPDLPALDPLEAAQEAARHAQEGSLKLSRAVDALRAGLETILIAEVDNTTGRPTTTKDLRGIAVNALNAYSQITGQNWRRHKLVGSWAGDRSLDETEE